MAAVASTTGLVTSWGSNGSATDYLIGSSVSTSNPAEFTLNMNAPEEDVTAFVSGGLNSMSYIPNLISWDGSIKCFMKPATLGSSGLLTFSGMPTSTNVVNCKSWEVTLNSTPQDVTAFASGGTTYRSFIPTIYNWKGTAQCYLDGTTSLVAPGAAAATATFKITEGGSPNDPGFSGSAFATQFGAPVKVGSTTLVNYSLRGTSDLTAVVGSSSYTSWWFQAGAIPLPVAGSLVLQSVTTKTYTGSAFWKSLKISCMVDGVVTLDIGFQGTGALVIA